MYCASSIKLCAVEVTCGGHASIEGPSWVPMHEDLVGQQNPIKISRSGVHHSCVSLFIGQDHHKYCVSLFFWIIRTLELV
ncbi:hypothetical protein PanWU01x14_109430 [Parasponia andersonii]|uniref:Uncharacterized protein n=1 Tax=Parasponia andersonii TaxID=3476 RepID=A0A2P5CZQ6_PARAD|nr:hypothetical protein PanWU01x14_109430 [Parasponia andersonii]